MTFDTPQSRSLLDGQDVVFVRHTYPRDFAGIAHNTATAVRMLGRRGGVSAVVSNGAALALAFLPYARIRGLNAYYIESGGRIHAPSLTGRLLEYLPGVSLFTQYDRYARGRWRYGGSILDGFSPAEPADADIRRLTVSLGTTPYGFRRLLERVLEIVPETVDVCWQVGPTDVTGLPVPERRVVPVHELEEDIRSSDAVIAHAGFATAVTALELGRCPVLVPRRRDLDENVDDHQLEIAGELANRGLAVARAVEELTWDDVVAAARKRVAVHNELPPIDLS